MFKFISTKTGLKLLYKIEVTSETQVKAGTIISPFLYFVFRYESEIIFADVPELTKTLYFTPSHFDHFFSNSNTFFPLVSLGLVFKKLITFYCLNE